MRRVNSVREALCALCRVLSASGSYWDPEMFRRSKFNRPEAASDFWNLVYFLLMQIFQAKQDSSPSPHEKITLADRVRYVKRALLIQGYGRPGFYSLPDDGEEGSREILLAFSWLLHRVKILQILLEKKRVKVGDHVTVCLCPHHVPSLKCKDISSSTKNDVDVRFLQWLNGKLRFSWRALYAAQLEECPVLYKIHSYTQGCHIDKTASHLSVMETELVRQPKKCDKLLQALDSEISYLEAYMEWKHAESVYWQWMDTVLESACEEEHNPLVQNINTIFVTSSSQLQYDIRPLSKRLHDTQHELHKLAVLRNSAPQDQIKEIEREFGEKELKKIKQEVKKMAEHCKPQGAEAEDIHGSYRLLLKERTLQKSANKDCPTRDVHVTEVTKCLQSAISKMEVEYCRLQDECRKRLDDITEELEGIICIPAAKG